MFDYYEPRHLVNCPVCKRRLDWQGHDGPCALAVWREGMISPTDQRVDAECQAKQGEIDTWRLPHEFIIDAGDCECSRWFIAQCKTIDGVWASTELITAENATPWLGESPREFNERRRRLRA